MKKTLVLLLAIVLLLGLLPGVAFATEEEYVYPMESVEKLEGTIANASNTYVIVKGYHGAVIDLAGLDYDTVVIERNPGAQTMGYAFLREMPVVGEVPDYAGDYYAVVWDKAQRAQLEIPYDAAYLYIYYNSNETVFLPASVVFKNTGAPEEPDTEPDYDDPVMEASSITVATWNIGHFSIGVNSNTKLTDGQFQQSAQEYRSYIYDKLGADLITLNEYSAMFTPSYRAKNALFSQYTGAQLEGPQYRYSCNALFSRLPVEDLRVCSFACNQNATIQHTSLIKATDYYYLCGEILLGGETVTVVTAHLGFDRIKSPDTVCLDQIDELIRTFADHDRVLLMGDWNTREFSYFDRFVEAGYTLGNTNSACATFAYDSTNRALDNIIVKGLEVSDFRVHPTLLSDHYAVSATISLGDSGDVHEHRYEAVVTPPTCDQGGYTTHTCVCGDSYVDTLTDADHQPEITVGVEPTCTETGLTEGQRCALCGEILREQTQIPAAGHDYGPWSSGQEDGVEQRQCTLCGSSQSREEAEKEAAADAADPFANQDPEAPASSQTASANGPVKQERKEDPLPIGWLIALGAALLTAAAGTAVFLLMRKKK